MPFNPATFFSSMKKRFARPESIRQERKDGSQVASIQPGDPQNGILGRSSEGAVALSRINRELRAISDCVQALVHAEDESSLLNDICRIICEEAGYRMAWVGYAEHDDAKTVRPVAWAGAEDGYLAASTIRWSDTEFGRGPAGTAIRTAKKVYIQDFSTDPRVFVWRENALHHGYRSCISLPLLDESGCTFGSLNLYYAEANAFTSDEIRLLEELAGHLAFGVTTLRARVARKQAEVAQQVIENALRISEEKFANAFYYSPALLTITRIKDQRVIEANQAFLDAFGFSRDEVINHSTVELGLWNEPRDREPFLEMFHQGIKHVPLAELHGCTRSNHSILLKGSLNFMQIAGEDYTLAVLENITERDRAERALRESEARFQTLVEQAPVAIMIARNGTPIYANQSLIRMMGIENGAEDLHRAKSLQRPIVDYFVSEQREEAIEIIQRRSLGLPSTEELDIVLLREDGSRFPAHVSIGSIHLSDGPASVSFIIDVTERKQAEAQIEASLQQLHTLSAHLQTIREEERTNIAREIHDELGQALTGFKMELFWIKNRFERQDGEAVSEPILNKLSSLLLETDQIINVVRRISTDLRPSILDTLGLLAALEWLTGDFQSRSGISCLFQTPLKTLQVPQDFSTAVFRICQEALTNVARHAQGKCVVVQLNRQDENLVLTIEDNGRGITDEEIHRPASLGILGMKERALGFHGQMYIQRSAQGGSCVTAWLPLPQVSNGG